VAKHRFDAVPPMRLALLMRILKLCRYSKRWPAVSRNSIRFDAVMLVVREQLPSCPGIAAGRERF